MRAQARIGIPVLQSGEEVNNGFHDAAHTIATSISTRALTPRVAVVLTALMNLLGAFLGEGVARTIGQNIIAPPSGSDGLLVL